jgi:hypothetical protein
MLKTQDISNADRLPSDLSRFKSTLCSTAAIPKNVGDAGIRQHDDIQLFRANV